jgi:hypothetical protein
MPDVVYVSVRSVSPPAPYVFVTGTVQSPAAALAGVVSVHDVVDGNVKAYVFAAVPFEHVAVPAVRAWL